MVMLNQKILSDNLSVLTRFHSFSASKSIEKRKDLSTCCQEAMASDEWGQVVRLFLSKWAVICFLVVFGLQYHNQCHYIVFDSFYHFSVTNVVFPFSLSVINIFTRQHPYLKVIEGEFLSRLNI